MARALMSIGWPSFLTAAVAEMVFFAFFDPEDMHMLGEPLALSRMTVYSIGFFFFWALTATSSFLTWFLLRPSAELNA